MQGERADPRLRSHAGRRLRDKRSAVRFRPDGIKRTDNFIEKRYLICSMAATKVQMMGSGDLFVPNQATTFELSEYNIIRCLGYLCAKS